MKIEDLEEKLWLAIRWGFPVFFLLYGIAIYAFPQPRWLEFNEGIAIELFGFSITILFFDFVVLKQYESARQKREESASNKKIYRLLSKGNSKLKLAISLSLEDRRKALNGNQKSPGWRSILTPDMCANALKKRRITYNHIALRADGARGIDEAFDAFKESYRHLSTLLPTATVVSERGEGFYDLLIKAYLIESQLNERLNAVFNAIERAGKLHVHQLTTNPSDFPQDFVFREIRYFYSALQKYVIVLDDLSQYTD